MTTLCITCCGIVRRSLDRWSHSYLVPRSPLPQQENSPRKVYCARQMSTSQTGTAACIAFQSARAPTRSIPELSSGGQTIAVSSIARVPLWHRSPPSSNSEFEAVRHLGSIISSSSSNAQPSDKSDKRDSWRQIGRNTTWPRLECFRHHSSWNRTTLGGQLSTSDLSNCLDDRRSPPYSYTR